MKKILPIILLTISAFSLKAQDTRFDQLQALEQDQLSGPYGDTTAILKSASRLFGEKDDLTTVITIIPANSVISVLDIDSTYLHVVYEDNKGYIFRRQAELNITTVSDNHTGDSGPAVQQVQPPEEQQHCRFLYLENKYGTNMASRLTSGKIWKGMNSEMVKDSWGVSQKINRVISGNTIKEEWLYRSTWLYFENNTLIDWGPIRR